MSNNTHAPTPPKTLRSFNSSLEFDKACDETRELINYCRNVWKRVNSKEPYIEVGVKREQDGSVPTDNLHQMMSIWATEEILNSIRYHVRACLTDALENIRIDVNEDLLDTLLTEHNPQQEVNPPGGITYIDKEGNMLQRDHYEPKIKDNNLEGVTRRRWLA